MKREQLIHIAHICALVGVVSFALWLYQGIHAGQGAGAVVWRSLLLLLGLFCTFGLLRRKNWARRVQMGLSSLTVFNVTIYLWISYRLQLDTVPLAYPVTMLLLNLGALTALIVCKREFISATIRQKLLNQPLDDRQARRYNVGKILPAVLLILGAGICTADEPTILTVNTKHANHGSTTRGIAIQDAFTVTNNSDLPVALQTKASCGCTILRSPKVIEPHESASLRYYIHTFGDNAGTVEKAIIIDWTQNDLKGNLRLEVKYELHDDLVIYENQRYITRKQNVATMVWGWKDKRNPAISAIVPNPVFDFVLEKLDSDLGWILRLTAKPYKPLEGRGGQTEYAQLILSDGSVLEIPFSVSNEYESKEGRTIEKFEKTKG